MRSVSLRILITSLLAIQFYTIDKINSFCYRQSASGSRIYSCYAKRLASHSYYIAFGDSVLPRLIKSIPSVTAYLQAAAEYTAEAYTNSVLIGISLLVRYHKIHTE